MLNVADTGRDSVTRIRGEIIDVIEEEGQRIVDEAAQRAEDRGVSVISEFLQDDPYKTIVDQRARNAIEIFTTPPEDADSP